MDRINLADAACELAYPCDRSAEIAGEELTQEDLRELCDWWQKVLRLQDWTIHVDLVAPNEFAQPGDKQAECHAKLSMKMAVIRVLSPAYYRGRDFPQDMEDSLVHELLHLHFHPFDTFDGDTLQSMAVEQAINAIAGALVKMKRTRRA